LKFRAGHRGWSLAYKKQRLRGQKGFPAQEPHGVLLGFSVANFASLQMEIPVDGNGSQKKVTFRKGEGPNNDV